MPTVRQRRRSICWHGVRLARCRNISGSNSSDVNVEQRYNANGQRVTVAWRVVKVDVDGEKTELGGGGHGPSTR